MKFLSLWFFSLVFHVILYVCGEFSVIFFSHLHKSGSWINSLEITHSSYKLVILYLQVVNVLSFMLIFVVALVDYNDPLKEDHSYSVWFHLLWT